MFIYSLPIFFTQLNLISPVEALFILLGIFALVFLSSPETEVCRQQTEVNYLFGAWLGALPLWSIFWPFFGLLNIVLFAIDTLAKTGHFTVSSWDDIHFILLFPIIWWTVGVWRGSANTSFQFWSACARVATLSVFLEYALKLYIRIDYPRIFFNCEDLLLDYGSCF